MTKIWGLDIATKTGVAQITLGAWPSTWRCFTVECAGETPEEKAGDLAIFLYAEVLANRPDFVAIEMPMRSVTRFERKGRPDLAGEGKPGLTINPNALQLSTLAGAAVAVLDICGVGYGLIAPASWRSAYFGRGFKPAKDWKSAAVELALVQKIALPASVVAQRDAAEAVGIGVSWTRCTAIPARHQQAFLDLRTGKARAAA